jgi:sugar (pentulose or hexulose) kinase
VTADLVLGVDSSTTACKVIAWDREGRAVAEGRAPIGLDNPAPDGWEQDSASWWQALCRACQAVAAAVDPGRFAALCITHQRETFVFADATGKALAPALVWMDARATAEVAEAVAELGAERLHRLSGKPPCVTPSLYKAMWQRRARPELERASCLLDVHAALVWRLTGRRATSWAAADPTGLVDMQTRGWSQPLLDLLGLAAEDMPELVAPGEVIAGLDDAAASATGLPAGLPVVAGAGDGQCAGLGAGIVAPGRAYLNLGTAIVSGVLSEHYATDGAFRTLFDATGQRYFLETDLQGGTFTITWLVDRWLRRHDVSRSFDEVLAELDERAAALPVGADGLVVLPYWNGVMNPFWDDRASGVVIGWRGSHEPAHLFRAILEGIALEQRLHTAGVEAAGVAVDAFVVMGGGSKSAMWCQIVADVLGRPVERAGSTEATALGAGILAAVGCGLHADVDTAVAAMTHVGRRFLPGPDRAAYARLYDEVYAGLYESVAPKLRALWRFRTGG